MIRSLAIALLIVALLVDSAAGSTPAGRQYAVWNENDANADIGLSEDALTAFVVPEGNGWAAVRATVPVASGSWYWETTVNFTGSANFSVGVATAGFSLDEIPGLGNSGASVGLLSNGRINHNSSPAYDLGAIASGSVVRHWLDRDNGSYSIAINDGDWYTVPIQLVHVRQYAIVGMFQPVGSTVFCTANFGQEPFAYDVPAGAHAGLYTDGPMIFLSGFEPGA
jgi:hypothetical protein